MRGRESPQEVIDRALAEQNLGRALVAAGRPAEAAGAFESSLAVLERAFGTDHPLAIGLLSDLAAIDRARGHLARAAERSRARLERVLRVHGPDAAETGTARQELGQALVDAGELDGARRELDEALRIAEQDGTEEPGVGAVRYDLAVLELAAGRPAEAIAQADRALALVGARPEWAAVAANARGLLGVAERRRGDLRVSRAHLAAALPAAQQVYGERSASTMYQRIELAHTEAALGDHAAAAALLEEALAVAAEDVENADPGNVAEARLALAELVWGREPTRARNLAAQAHAGYAALGPTYAGQAREAAMWLWRHP
jgi:tetratricopeptide (TPR) repeat protein